MHITGTVDEAQAAMGLARAEATARIRAGPAADPLERDLYVLMAEVTTDPSNRSKLKPGTTLVTDEMVSCPRGRTSTTSSPASTCRPSS